MALGLQIFNDSGGVVVDSSLYARPMRFVSKHTSRGYSSNHYTYGSVSLSAFPSGVVPLCFIYIPENTYFNQMKIIKTATTVSARVYWDSAQSAPESSSVEFYFFYDGFGQPASSSGHGVNVFSSRGDLVFDGGWDVGYSSGMTTMYGIHSPLDYGYENKTVLLTPSGVQKPCFFTPFCEVTGYHNWVWQYHTHFSFAGFTEELINPNKWYITSLSGYVDHIHPYSTVYDTTWFDFNVYSYNAYRVRYHRAGNYLYRTSILDSYISLAHQPLGAVFEFDGPGEPTTAEAVAQDRAVVESHHWPDRTFLEGDSNVHPIVSLDGADYD